MFHDEKLQKHLEVGGNYGVLSGIGNLIIVDIDKPELVKDVKLPRTFTVKTGNGFHLYYLVKNFKKKIILEDDTDTHVGEIQAKGQYVVGPSCIHPSGATYEVVEDIAIREITPEEILAPLQDFIPLKNKTKQHAIDKLPITRVAMPLNYKEKEDGSFQGAHPFHSSSTGTNFKLDPNNNLWCCFQHNTGGTVSYLIAIKHGILKCGDCKAGALRGAKFKKVLRIAEQEYGLKIKRNQIKEEVKEIHFLGNDDEIVEEIMYKENNEDVVKFVVKKQDEDEILIEDEYKGYSPVYNNALKKRAVLLPTGFQKFETVEILIQDIQKHINKYLDVDKSFEKYAAYYVLLSWVYDKVNSVPYLRALGDTGTGKSRFLDVIGGICYKPIRTAGSATPAPIFRLLEFWKGTLLLDEADRKKSDTGDELVKILNCGFERDRPVVRCDKENPNDIQIHEVFGPKIITSRYRFYDKALEARCITNVIQETSRTDIPPQLTRKFKEQEDELRKKLLYFRLMNWHAFNMDSVEESFGKLNELEPRLRQTASAFFILFNNPVIEKEFIGFMKEYNQELINERADSLEGKILNTICQLQVDFEEITSSDVTDEINKDRNDKNKFRPATIGKIIKSLGFSIKVRRSGPKIKRIIEILPKNLKTLKKRYGVILETSKQQQYLDFAVKKEDFLA